MHTIFNMFTHTIFNITFTHTQVICETGPLSFMAVHDRQLFLSLSTFPVASCAKRRKHRVERQEGGEVALEPGGALPWLLLLHELYNLQYECSRAITWR